MSDVIRPMQIGYDTVDLSWINGRVITDVSFLEPTRWHFSLGASERIAVDCLWRILRGGRIVLTGLDHGQRFGPPTPVDAARDAMKALSEAHVTHVQLREATADITMMLDGNLCLEIIPDSCGYESWELHAPAGRHYVAQDGGQICTWTR